MILTKRYPLPIQRNFIWTFAFLLSVSAAHIFTFIMMPLIYGRPDVAINGKSTRDFEPVAEVFRKNFADGFERDGAAIAVFHKGQPVVDIWGGNADTKNNIPWTLHTRNILFSATKPLAALCVALLVDRGHLRWDDPVAKYWPEYAQNGKENTTIDHVLSHQAGVPYTTEAVTYNDAFHVDGVLKKLARSEPLWTPGTASGYHALTFGWLLDGIVRGADPLHRDLSTFFDEEIARPNGLDISIGVEPKDYHRTARLTQPNVMEFVRDSVMDPRMFFMLAMISGQPSSAPVHKMQINPDFFTFTPNRISLNELAIQRLRLGSATGISTARDLAQLFKLVLENKILSNATLNALHRPTLDTWHIEKTVMYPIMKGRGFFYDYHPQKWGAYVFGHPGYGCQSLHVDPSNDLVVVYLTNGLKTATSYLCHPYQRLLKEVYRIVQ